MSDKRKAPLAPEGAQSRKLRSPIIDLTATEIRSDADESAAFKPSPDIDDESSPAKEKTSSEHIASENAVHAPKPNQLVIAVLAAAILGAVAGFVFAVMLWSKGPPQAAINSNDVNAQITELQRQITNLNNQSRANRAANGDLAQRLNTTENAIKSFRAMLDGFMSRNENIAGQIARLSEQTDAAEKAVVQLRSVQRVEQTASTAVDPNLLNSLQQRLAAFEQSIKDTNAEIAKFAAVETSTRLALIANALRAAVMSGAPYQDELKQAKSLYGDDKIFAPLEPFAVTGVVSEPTLAGELRNLIPLIKEAIRTEVPASGFFQRLQAGFSSLVRITPVNVPSTDSVSDMLVRLDNAAARADMAAALSELTKLPERARAPAQAWIKQAQTRQAALATAQSFAAESARHLRPE